MTGEFDATKIEKLLRELIERQSGDWLLLGGSLVALWLQRDRVTDDIDLVGLGDSAMHRLHLMQFAHEMGLPIEAVNSAADFFVHRIEGWRQEIEVLYQWPKGAIYRPTPTLFLLLKLGRLSEQDLVDCRHCIRVAKAHSMKVDIARLLAALDDLPTSNDDTLTTRRSQLRAMIEGYSL